MRLDYVAFVLATAVCGTLAIVGRTSQLAWLHWAFKPTTVLVIIASVVWLARPSELRTLMLVALGFSLAGDVILMLPWRGFVYGLAAFLVALVVYAIAFLRQGDIRPWHFALVPLLLVAVYLVMRPLWPQLGALRIPVAVYSVTLCLTLWSATTRLGPPFASTAVLATAGAALFMLGDTLLAYARFSDTHIPYPLELGTYFAAQLTLAASLWVGSSSAA